MNEPTGRLHSSSATIRTFGSIFSAVLKPLHENLNIAALHGHPLNSITSNSGFPFTISPVFVCSTEMSFIEHCSCVPQMPAKYNIPYLALTFFAIRYVHSVAHTETILYKVNKIAIQFLSYIISKSIKNP